MRRLLCCLLCCVPGVSLALEVDNPSEYFMRLCLKDATVAAGKREQLCACVHNGFAYGAQTGFGLSDAITLDPWAWEAPEKRMPADELGQAVRQIRKQCQVDAGATRARNTGERVMQ